MVDCPICKVRVNSILLRSENPKCAEDHDLGTWQSCTSTSEKHVYLAPEPAKCPYCGSAASKSPVKEGTKVKCLHETAVGLKCQTRPFAWISEGPPCFMNHVGKFAIAE